MPKSKLTAKDYENIGRMTAAVYENGYIDRRRLLEYSFVKGVMVGAGGVIGATIMVALLLWLLSLTSNIPLVGQVSHNLHHAVQNYQK